MSVGYAEHKSTPAMAARPEPMAKTMAIVALTSMPMSWAAPLSSETARMALPILVLVVNSVRPTMITMLARTVTSVTELTTSSPPNKDSEGMAMTCGNDFGSLFQMRRARFCSRYETPMAVIRTSREGASRSGL